jgi:nicotinamide riboside kinase
LPDGWPPRCAARTTACLLGPRQTGKSTLVADLAPDLTINLFHEPTYLEFARNPRELEERAVRLHRQPRAATGLRSPFCRIDVDTASPATGH